MCRLVPGTAGAIPSSIRLLFIALHLLDLPQSGGSRIRRGIQYIGTVNLFDPGVDSTLQHDIWIKGSSMNRIISAAMCAG